MTDFRALCAELVDIATAHCNPDDYAVGYCASVLSRARAALAQPEPQGPTDGEIDALLPLGMAPYTTICGPREIHAFARAVLARWGRPAIEPVPLAERLPGPEDCDEEGRCWLYEHFIEEWRLGYGSWVARFPIAYSHWLPHHALPVPQQEADRG